MKMLPGFKIIAICFNGQYCEILAYVIHNRRDGGRIDGPLCLKRLDVVQRIGIKQLKKNKRSVNNTFESSLTQSNTDPGVEPWQCCPWRQ